jgi:hypothetical protein
MTDTRFLAPRFTGKRFENHSLPVSVLEDLAAFEDLLVEMAKYIYLEENPQRQRVPRGFTEGISLQLSSVEQGSAIPVLMLASNMAGLFPSGNVSYFEKAKDRVVLSIQAAGNGKPVTDFLPEQFLGYFNRIGKNLQQDEQIEFSAAGTTSILSRETRKKIVLASPKIHEVISSFEIRCSISELNKGKNTFEISYQGRTIKAVIQPEHREQIWKAFDGFENNQKVLISGSGFFDKTDTLTSIDHLDHISLVDSLDVSARLEDLANLSDGWLNGEGNALSPQGLIWIEESLNNNLDPALPLPFLFPTVEGDIVAEWKNDQYDISIEFELQNKTAYIHVLATASGQIEELFTELPADESWKPVNDLLTRLLITA